MIGVTISQASVEAVKKALGDLSHRYPREIATAINATAKQVRIQASRKLKTGMNLPSKLLKKAIYSKSANPESLRAVIGLYRGHPFPLKYFKAKQIKRGVTYKINPTLKGKSVLRDAFIVRQYGGNVYLRSGTARGPLIKQHGPAPGEAFERLGIAALAVAVATEELPKQINRRIRFLNLKASGGLRGKQT